MDSKKSLFIITFGPAGSGKGYIERFLFDSIYANLQDKLYPRDTRKQYYARIDDYVDMDFDYNYNVAKYLKENIFSEELYDKHINVINQQPDNIINNIINSSGNLEINNMLKRIAENFTQFYFSRRRYYSTTLDNELNRNLKDRNNIIYETTGISKIDWIFTNTFLKYKQIRDNYYVVIVYPFVDNTTILTRALTRFAKRAKALHDDNIHLMSANELSEYISNKISSSTYSPPRLPLLVGDNSLKDSISIIQQNISHYIESCISNIGEVDIIMLYDNNNIIPKLIINRGCDGARYKENCNKIQDLLNTYRDNIDDNLVKSLETYKCNDIMTGGNNYKAKYLKYKGKYLQKKRLLHETYH